MNSAEQTRFDGLYRRHLRALKLQGMSDSTIDVYARAVRRVMQYYDCCPDRLTTEQLDRIGIFILCCPSFPVGMVDDDAR